MKKNQSNDQTWHELRDRMSDDRCPVCQLIHDRISQHMDTFLYEGVTDRDLRRIIRDAKGFCNYHAHMMLKKGDPLAHALLYTDLISGAVYHFKNKRIKAVYQHHAGCLFCRQSHDAEKRYLSVFADGFDRKDFADKYKAGALLCVPHMELIRTHKHKANVAAITQITLQKYDELLAHLSELRRKHDYRFTHEPWTEDEKLAWKRVVIVHVGKEGIR